MDKTKTSLSTFKKQISERSAYKYNEKTFGTFGPFEEDKIKRVTIKERKRGTSEILRNLYKEFH